jgi:hypothetical protein
VSVTVAVQVVDAGSITPAGEQVTLVAVGYGSESTATAATLNRPLMKFGSGEEPSRLARPTVPTASFAQ